MDYEHWFNLNKFDKEYYAYRIYKNIILHIKDVPDGYIVVLGTNNCISFDLLCQFYGYDRCIGYDLFNPTNHPRVKIKNVLDLDNSDNIPIAFVHNDIGNFELTPRAKLYAQSWAAKNVVKNGYFLGRTNQNYAKFNLEQLMTDEGFYNYNLQIASTFLDTSLLTKEELMYHLLSKKVN